MSLFYLYDTLLYKIKAIFRIYDPWEKHMRKMFKRGYYDENCVPQKCYKCGNTDFNDENFGYMDTTLCEFDIVCKKCGTMVASWAFGYFNMPF